MEIKTTKKWIAYPFYISGEIVYLFSFALICVNFMIGSASPYYELVKDNSIKLLLFSQLIILASFFILFVISFFIENLKRFVPEFFLFISFHIALLVISIIFIIPAL